MKADRFAPGAVRPLQRALLLVVLLVSGGLALACGKGNEAGVVRIEAAGKNQPEAQGGAALGRPPGQPAERLTVFLDAGHGGSDPGFGSSYATPGLPPEKDLNLDVAKRTAVYLEAAGYKVVLSRSEDIQVNSPARDLNGDGCIDPIDEIQARIDMANASGAAVMLSIHFNGAPGTQLNGPGTYYNAVREFSDKNKLLADLIQDAQLKTLAGFNYQPHDWGALRDDSIETGSRSQCATSKYYALLGPAMPGRPRPSLMPAVIAESMFLTYPKEGELAGRAEVRDALAKAYAQALEQFLTSEHGQRIPGRPDGVSTLQAGLTSASGPPALLVDRGDRAAKTVALTFDAGAGAGFTSVILDTLARRGIKGTFGLTGVWCEANADLCRRITAEGHTVLNHTYDHASWTGLSPHATPLSFEQRRDEIERAATILLQTAGSDGRPFFRSPYGDEDASVQRDLGALGYRYNVLWTFDSNGWRGAKAADIIERGIKAAAPGAIYVFHVAEQQDALALERLIDGIIAAGYGFDTVQALVKQS